MAEAEGIPPTASTASVGFGIRYVGIKPMFAYAFSGAVSVDNTETTILLFDSQAGVINAIFRPCYLQAGGDDYEFRVYFNDLIIAYTKATSEATIPAQKYFELIIPPQTEFKVTGKNIEISSSLNIGALLTGRVYDA